MKLVRAPQTDDLQSEIKRRFAEFNRSRPASKGRRYPAELKELVSQAGVQGLKSNAISRLTGLSTSAVHRWLTAPMLPAARRLSVVADTPIVPSPAGAVVRLPSGVTIELADGRCLSGELLTALSALESRHAASR